MLEIAGEIDRRHSAGAELALYMVAVGQRGFQAVGGRHALLGLYPVKTQISHATGCDGQGAHLPIPPPDELHVPALCPETIFVDRSHRNLDRAGTRESESVELPDNS